MYSIQLSEVLYRFVPKPFEFNGLLNVPLCSNVSRDHSSSEWLPCIHFLFRPLIDRSSSIESTSVQINHFEDADFSSLVRDAEDAILSGIHPEMISQGSSGSYFVRDIHSVCVLWINGVGEWGSYIRTRLTTKGLGGWPSCELLYSNFRRSIHEYLCAVMVAGWTI